MRLWLFLGGLLMAMLSPAQGEPLWFAGDRQQQAAGELRAQLAVLAAADLDPRFDELYREIIATGERAELSPLYTETYLLMHAFWRELEARPAGKLDLSQRFDLHPRPGLTGALARDAHQGRLMERVLALEPEVTDYLAIRNAVARFDYLAQRELISAQPLTGLLEPGAQSPQVTTARRQLYLLEDLASDTGSDVYDPMMVAAVRQFQQRHGLVADGIIGPQTYGWLIQPFERRAKLMARSLIRQSHDALFMQPSHLRVNIPAFELVWYEQGERQWQTEVVVGLPARATPTMHSELNYVVLNPSWNVPRSILFRDLLPRMAKDIDYAERHRYEVIGPEDEVLPLSAEEIQQLAQQGFPYRLRQQPGPGNALGQYKFHLANSRAIYLHDTPQQSHFGLASRAYSSGCVRVAAAEELAQQLLTRSVAGEEQVARWQQQPHSRWVALDPLPTYLVYWTAWIEKGRPQFREDLYHWED
ncbi:L,D-transpeptidase family protein [Ferrimonas marina]|uniref:Murein L,D-transpeptidase YcbB/YkuD n=1 Tax=Ferrimonas marina TaxID=299255 RepID=A0A1M5YU69_9GAMM|nr:L,D-transpeptidase family protein [Ferrimonas marina]SHI15667.1 Murein L,D-transpeptidase YcbB/YkuD [Ferrimonas marina]